jgi:hypothetical protein
MSIDNPYEYVDETNKLLLSQEIVKINEGLMRIEAYFKEFPEGQPNFSIYEVLESAPPLDGLTLHRLVLEGLRFVDSCFDIVFFELVWDRCSKSQELPWLIYTVVDFITEKVEPEHLPEDHVLLEKLQRVPVSLSLLQEILNKTISTGHFASFGILLRKFFELNPSKETEDAVLNLIAEHFDEGPGYIEYCLQSESISTNARSYLQKLLS